MRLVGTVGGLSACIMLVILLRGIGGSDGERLLDPVKALQAVTQTAFPDTSVLGPNWEADVPRSFPDLAGLARGTSTPECEKYVASIEDARKADAAGLAAKGQQKFTRPGEVGSGYYWVTVSVHENVRQAQEAFTLLVSALAMPERLKCAEAETTGTTRFIYSAFGPSAEPPHEGRVFADRASAVPRDPTRDNVFWSEVYVWRSRNALVTVFTSFPTRDFITSRVATFVEIVTRSVDGSARESNLGVWRSSFPRIRRNW